MIHASIASERGRWKVYPDMLTRLRIKEKSILVSMPGPILVYKRREVKGLFRKEMISPRTVRQSKGTPGPLDAGIRRSLE
jgi:hypothetical protein